MEAGSAALGMVLAIPAMAVDCAVLQRNSALCSRKRLPDARCFMAC